MSSRKFGWHSGQVHALNIQSGTVNITTDGSGDGTKAVTFKNTFKSVPSITLTAKEADDSGTLSVTGSDVTGFTARVKGSSVTNDTLSVGYIAIDQTV